MLQQRGFYTIELSDGTKVPLRFCTWTLKQFSESNNNMSLSALGAALKEGLGISAMASLILCAAQYMCIKESRQFNHTEMDACDWIDEMGGVSGQGFLAMVNVIVESFTDNSSNGQEKKIPETAKI